MGSFDQGVATDYALKAKRNGVYVFVLQGSLTANGQRLDTRDGYGIWEIDKIQLEAVSEVDFLLMEVPMEN